MLYHFKTFQVYSSSARLAAIFSSSNISKLFKFIVHLQKMGYACKIAGFQNFSSL